MLNCKQLQYINSPIDRHNVIIARAGTGKTTTILERIKLLIDKYKTPPSRILLTTFTVSATKDIKSKLNRNNITNINVGTLDSIALTTLQKWHPEVVNEKCGVTMYTPLFYDFLRYHSNKIKFFEQYDYCFVDEYQDIDREQNRIFLILKKYMYIIAIGDPSQNIYHFRGSNPKYLNRFHSKYSNATQFTLMDNYRSVPEILHIANQTLQNSDNPIPKIISTKSPNKKKPDIVVYTSEKQQSYVIMSKIKYYLQKLKYKYSDICILARNNYLLYGMEEMLTKCQIPNQLIENVGKHQNKVWLSTIHKSKGLEWKIVFFIGCHDRIIPYSKNSVDIMEERRLFYVAVTRAKYRLHFSLYPFNGKIHLTRFISELSPYSYYSRIPLKNEYFMESDNIEKNIDNWNVTSLINKLTGRDMIELEPLLPNITYKVDQQLHKPYNYPKLVEDYNIYMDYGIFIDLLISRQLGQYNHYSTEKILYSIEIPYKSWYIYLKYKKCIDEFITDIYIDIAQPIHSYLDLFFNKYTINIKTINKDRNTLIDIITTSVLHIKNGLFKGNINFVRENCYPKDYLHRLQKSYNNFKNKNIEWYDIISDIFEISKCDTILKNNRRRLMYINQLNKLVTSDMEWYHHINQFFCNKMKSQNTICHHSIINDQISGNLDLLVDDTIIDYKVSYNDKINIEWILQLLLYTYLARKKGHIINNIGIYNPLIGKLRIINIEKWDKEKELVDFILVRIE